MHNIMRGNANNILLLKTAFCCMACDGKIASEAEFRLRGKGGLALNKWRSVDTKIDELVDELLNDKHE